MQIRQLSFFVSIAMLGYSAPALCVTEDSNANTTEKTIKKTIYNDDSSTDDRSAIVIDEISIQAPQTSAEDTVFSTAGAVVIRGENKTLQSLDSVVRSLPGTYTNIDPAQGTVNVNIRGMSGLGRVNTTVDDVPQTFFGTSSNGSSRFHDDEGGLAPSSQYGTMIDLNFLVQVAINKGHATGAQSINALAGTAALKTMGVDDIVDSELLEYQNSVIGGRIKTGYGSNELGYNGMLAVAGKTKAFDDKGSIGAMLAVSQQKKGANYKRGDGLRATTNKYVKKMDQKPRSWLSKLEVKPDNIHNLMFSTRGFTNNIGGRSLENTNVSLNYGYSPDSDFVDLSVLASVTQNTQKYDNDSALWQLTEASTTNKSRYFDINNTSYFYLDELTNQPLLADASVKSTYGISYFDNDYARTAKGINDDNLAYTPFAPSGTQKITSLHTTTTMSKDIFNKPSRATLGLNFVNAQFMGFKPACESVGGYEVPCFPKGAANIDMQEKSVNPTLMLATEMTPLFKPFVSVGRSERMPNIQEVFFNNESGGSMNPFLKPEIANTYQLGFNGSQKNLFAEGDAFNIKAVYFNSKIRNFISSQSFYISEQGDLTNDINQVGPVGFHAQIATNASKPVKMYGVEVESGYEYNNLYGRLSYSYEKTSQPVGVQSSVDGFGFGDIYELPKHYAVLDVGGNFFDDTLTVGTLVKYTGQVKRLSPKGIDIDKQALEEPEIMPTSPVIADVYASYTVNDNLSFTASVQNVFDDLYIDPLNTQNTTKSQLGNDGESTNFSNYARGRSILVSADYKF